MAVADLKTFAGRMHFRPEFANKAGRELEARFGILMSWPRVGTETVLGFASWRVVDGWRRVPELPLQTVLNDKLDERHGVRSIRMMCAGQARGARSNS